MKRSIYDYVDYKRYLISFFSYDKGQKNRSRSQLATMLNVRPSFISQVLNGHLHLTPEHAVLINDYLDHTEGESDYFLLLIHLGRAGSKKLCEIYLKQIEKIQKHREEIRERIQVKEEISKEDQMTYYSSWHYAAAHVLVSIKNSQTIDILSKHLGTSLIKTKEILELLESIGLISSKGRTYTVGKKRIHLSHTSPLISKHHTNWRLRAIESMDHTQKNDLHYSTVFAVSKKDIKCIREFCLKLIEETEAVLRPSIEETVGVLTLDLFRI